MMMLDVQKRCNREGISGFGSELKVPVDAGIERPNVIPCVVTAYRSHRYRRVDSVCSDSIKFNRERMVNV